MVSAVGFPKSDKSLQSLYSNFAENKLKINLIYAEKRASFFQHNFNLDLGNSNLVRLESSQKQTGEERKFYHGGENTAWIFQLIQYSVFRNLHTEKLGEKGHYEFPRNLTRGVTQS